MPLTDDDGQLVLPIADIGIHRMRAERLKEACRIVSVARGFDRMARELEAVFQPLGRPVSLGTLHNTLGDHERHYMRAEWIPVFAQYNDEVAQIIAESAGKTLAPTSSKLTPEQENELIKDRVVREFGAAGARLIASLTGGRRR